MKFFFTLCVLVTVFFASAQNSATNWIATPHELKVFIENKGQFDNLNNLPGTKVLFGTESISNQILFTRNGLTYRLEERVAPTEEEREEREKEIEKEIAAGAHITHRDKERRENKLNIRKDFIQMEWVNANPNVEVVALNTITSYFNYGMGSKGVGNLNGYKKILYKNLYPNIDVEYVLHPERGIEYSFVLYPGADPSQIKMKYSDVEGIKPGKNGSLIYPTLFGNITEHAPNTFYEANKKAISSKFVLNGNTVSFQLGKYDRSQKVILDPWVQTPSFNTQWDCVWECEKDAAGNVYIIGGVMPLQLLKYNSTGTLQWTYSTPYDTSNTWLGTFAVDDAGNSYVTEGTGDGIIKVNTAGNLVFNNPTAGGGGLSTEFWSISFNCDQTKLVVGGTGGTLPPQPYIYNIDMNSGNVTSRIQMTGGALIPTQEVRCITPVGNGKYYWLTHDSIGYLNQNFAICASAAGAKNYFNSTYGLGYKCENFRVDNTGIAALKAYGGFVYSVRGNQLHKRNIATGAIIATATIPSGVFTTQFGSSQLENAGIDIDNCGNIYVGSKNLVVKFDQSLTQVATYSTTFNVYDVHVSTNGDIIACGTNGNSSSGARQGYIQSIAASACAAQVQVCCDASICRPNVVCISTTPFTLTASTAGGVWSGTGITNSATGLFDPSVAGAGIFVIKYTLPCGSDSVKVTVSPCSSLRVCRETNGNLTVSNGVGTYTWSQQVQVQDCSACFPAAPPFIQACSIPPGCAVTVNAWQNFGTGTTVTPPSYPVRVIDEADSAFVVANANAVSACSASCTLNASTTPTATTCGLNNGAATVSATGATPTGYQWSNNLGTSASISNVAAGTYTVTVSANGCSATASAVIAASTAISASTTKTNASCTAAGSATVSITGGTATAYSWSNGATTATASNLAAGNYTVTVTATGGCTATASAAITSTGSITASASSTNAGCTSTGTATATIGGGTATAYSWSNGGTTATISNLAAGNYTVTITSGSCTATATTTVGSSGGLVLSSTTTAATCGGSNGSATVSVTSGTATGYSWSGGGTTATISNLPAGTYTVTVTGSGNCSATASAIVSSTSAPAITTSATNAGCNSNSGSATVSITSGTATAYNWSNGATTATASNLAAGNYTVTVTGNGNCTVSASVTVNTTGGVAISATSTNTSCGNQNGTATVSITSGNATSFNWSNGATTSSLTNLAAGNYTVTVNDAGGCSATASVTIGGSGANSVVISADDSTICSSDTARVCAPSGYASYLWNTGATTSCINVRQAGNYYVTVTDNGNCTATSNRLAITVLPSPPVSISVNNDSLLAYNSSGYQWFLNGNLIPGATTPLWVATQPGSYTVQVTGANGCKATSLPVVINVTGVTELEKETINIYPNPNSNGSWNLSVSKSWLNGQYEIFDAEGRLISRAGIQNELSAINVSVASGVYVIKLTAGSRSATYKLIKL